MKLRWIVGLIAVSAAAVLLAVCFAQGQNALDRPGTRAGQEAVSRDPDAVERAFDRARGDVALLDEFAQHWPIRLLSPRNRELLEDDLISGIESGRLTPRYTFRDITPLTHREVRPAPGHQGRFGGFTGRITLKQGPKEGWVTYLFETSQDVVRLWQEAAFGGVELFFHYDSLDDDKQKSGYSTTLPCGPREIVMTPGAFNIPNGHRSVFRISGTIEGFGDYTWIGEPDAPLTFVLLDGKGLVYVCGQGRVESASVGRQVSAVFPRDAIPGGRPVAGAQELRGETGRPAEAPTGGGSGLDKPGTRAGQEATGPDGGTYVWVPPGEFDMGASLADDFFASPVHHVRISKGFWLGKCTVTNGQYQRYCQEAGVEFPKDSDQSDTHPVVYVNWAEAEAYCKHYGLALPTEAQWEYAARGPENRKYPWGNESDPKKCCNEANTGPGGRTFPVGSFPEGASWCGALDMAGNVFQWCKDWLDVRYYASSPTDDPPGAGSGSERVLRGGGWDNMARRCRSSYRRTLDPACRGGSFGFRASGTP